MVIPILVVSCVIVLPWCYLKLAIAILLDFCCLRRQVLVIFVISFSFKNWQKTSLRQVQHAQIVTLYKEGYSESKIGAKCNVSITAVYTAIVNWRLRGSYSNLKRSGRPRKPL